MRFLSFEYRRSFFFAFAMGCLLLIGAGYGVQYAFDLLPCPLCLLQRLLYLLVALVALAAAVARPGLWGTRVFLWVMAAVAGLGLLVAARQTWGLHFPQPLGSQCITWLHPITDTLTALFESSANCYDRSFTLLGLAIPEWSLLAFALLAGVSLWMERRFALVVAAAEASVLSEA